MYAYITTTRLSVVVLEGRIHGDNIESMPQQLKSNPY